MLNLGVIGCGYWGPNLIRNFAQNPEAKIGVLCDINRERVMNIARYHPMAKIAMNYKEVLRSSSVDAVVIATGAKAHYQIAKEALNRGKHTLVEKPLALKYAQAKQLSELADKNKLVLMVSHTFLYNVAVRKLKEYIQSGQLGKILYLYASRLNLGIIRRDVNALWNFAPHDVSIICYLLNSLPKTVNARGLKYIHKHLEDVVFIDMEFSDGIVAHIHLSWIDPRKIRETIVVGTKRMIVYDDTSSDAKLKIFEKGFDKVVSPKTIPGYEDYGEFQLQLRDGDCIIPKLDFKEPLREECDHFIECILKDKRPLTDGRHAAEIVRIIETAYKSMRNNSKKIKL